jgi:hypothetical protein
MKKRWKVNNKGWFNSFLVVSSPQSFSTFSFWPSFLLYFPLLYEVEIHFYFSTGIETWLSILLFIFLLFWYSVLLGLREILWREIANSKSVELSKIYFTVTYECMIFISFCFSCESMTLEF